MLVQNHLRINNVDQGSRTYKVSKKVRKDNILHSESKLDLGIS